MNQVQTRRGGRGKRMSERQSTVVNEFDAAWRQWKNNYPRIEQFSADEIEAIHNASLKVLSDTGIKVLSDLARDYYSKAGMTVKGEIVHFDPELVLDLISKAPPIVTLHGRGKNRNISCGRDLVGISTTGGTANYSDLQQGRKPGTLSAFQDLCKVSQSFDVIHVIGTMVEAQDIPTNLRL